MDAKQTSNAFGLVGSQAGGLMQFMLSGSWVKRLHAGWTALTGVMSSRMARDGYTGPIDVLEGKYGYCRAYSTKYDTTAITRDLGKVYETLKVQPKVYPCCSELFSPIDAALGIMKENRLEPSDVQRIDVRGISIATDFCYNPREKKTRPATNVDAQFSLPFAVATAIHHQRASLPEFSSEEIMNEQVLQLADKVYATLDQELNAMFPGRAPAIVKITTRSGKSFAARVNDSKGTPENPMNHKELEEKFRICSAAASMSHETAEEVIRTVANLEDLQSVKMLTKMLSAWKA
jgi:2-methylcitrate dehydratase PrpD